jgi:hypothetical protein
MVSTVSLPPSIVTDWSTRVLHLLLAACRVNSRRDDGRALGTVQNLSPTFVH